MPHPAPPDEPRAAELVSLLQLQPHPEGGWYRETFRAHALVQPPDGRPPRSALTTIDFLLARGQASAWHRVASDEVWHLLEGGPLVLWLLPPALDRVERVVLAPADAQGRRPCRTVPAGWWQAAQPEDGYAHVGATVGPGFDFADFSFLRDHADGVAALRRLAPPLAALL
jgi:predicted cupin superfamily sugar epimerase